jgi:hypothetical protein
MTNLSIHRFPDPEVVFTHPCSDQSKAVWENLRRERGKVYREETSEGRPNGTRPLSPGPLWAGARLAAVHP